MRRRGRLHLSIDQSRGLRLLMIDTTDPFAEVEV